MKKIKTEIWIFVITFIILALFTKTYVGSGNVGSRFATIESLVERGTFVIDDSTFFGNAKTYPIVGEKPVMRKNNYEAINGTNDKVLINGHFYSDKPVVLPFLASGPYWVLNNLGINFRNHGGLATYLLTLFTVGIAVSFLAMFFYKFSKKNKINDKNSLILTFSLIFATLIFPFSVTFNNHIIAACFIFISFYLLMYGNKNWHYYIAGLLASLATVIDLVSGGIFMVGYLLYPIFKKKYVNSIFYLLGLIIPLLLHAVLTIPITGDILPGSMHAEYWQYPGSGFDETSLTGVAKQGSSVNVLVYSFHSLLGYRGLFLYTPLLALSIFLALKNINKNFKIESILILISCGLIISYYMLFSDNYGGWSYGIRWFVSFIPMLFLFNVYVFKENNYKLVKIFYILSVISLGFSIIGVYQPWTDMWYSQIPFINNLREIVQNLLHK